MPHREKKYWIDAYAGDERRLRRAFVSEEEMIALLTPVRIGEVTRVGVLDRIPAGYRIRYVKRVRGHAGFAIIVWHESFTPVPEWENRPPEMYPGVRLVEVRDRTEG
jgi:hypothetical protein